MKNLKLEKKPAMYTSGQLSLISSFQKCNLLRSIEFTRFDSSYLYCCLQVAFDETVYKRPQKSFMLAESGRSR